VDEVFKQARVRMTKELQRFFFRTDKPLILSVGRPERGKNIKMLIECYGQDKDLQAMANLAVFAGIRKDIEDMNPSEKEVLTEMLLLMDRYDLYGKMAAPKEHSSETDIPELYRLAASGRGIFVSPAHVENFGLTLLESAAAGLPFVGTQKGGPVDIVENIESGLLVDLESGPADLTATMKRLLSDERLWQRLSENGINGVRRFYTWQSHCDTYVDSLRALAPARSGAVPDDDHHAVATRFARMERLLVMDIDDTLLGDPEGLRRFKESIRTVRPRLGIGVATGRSHDAARAALSECGLDGLDVIIASVGSEIYYGPDSTPDRGWASHVRYKWHPQRVRAALDRLPFLRLQEQSAQRDCKISYVLDVSQVNAEEALPRIHTALSRASASYTLILSHGTMVDILPCRASKGKAIRYLSFKWGIAPKKIITAGNSGNDTDMLLGRVSGIVVGNHEKELEGLRNADWVYFADASHADGIIEGLRHYHVL
jgi:sucrose-phosphate synthase